MDPRLTALQRVSGRRMNRRAFTRSGLAGLGALTTGALSFAACSSSNNNKAAVATAARTAASPATAGAPPAAAGRTSTPTAEKPVLGGTLKMGTSRFPTNLDPHLATDFRSQRFTEQIYTGLLRFSPTLEYEPDLASKYEYADPTTLTVTVRSGVKFHDGTPLTSADVAYTVERINAAGFPAGAKSIFSSISSVQTVDPQTAVFKLKAPNAGLLDAFPIASTGIVSKSFTEAKQNKLDAVANGTGPFMLKEWVTGVRLSMVKNPQYYEAGLPYFDGLLYTPVVDDTARAAALRAGDVNIIDYVPFPEYARLKQGPGTVLSDGIEYGKWRSIRINHDNPLFKDVRVRQALNLGLDRGTIASTIVGDFGGVWSDPHPLPKQSWAYTPDGVTGFEKQDLTKAKQLLTAAGHATDLKLQLKLFQGSNWPDQTGALFQADMKKLGVEISLVSQDNNTYTADLAAGKFELGAVGGGTTGPDPDYLYTQLHSAATTMIDRFGDPALDKLLESGRTTIDRDARKKIYGDALRRVAELAPWIIVLRADDREAISAKLRGYLHMPSFQMVTLRKSWLAS